MERMRLGINKAHLEDSPEKSQYKASCRSGDLPEHLGKASAAIKRHTKSGEFEEGWQVFRDTPDADGPLCNAALNLCAKAGWSDRAWKLWEAMGTKSQRSRVSYGTMIDVCARCKQPEQAEKLFQEALSLGETPDIILYSSLMNAFGLARMSQRALEVFRSIPPEVLADASLQGKHITFLVVMSAFARDGDYGTTRELFTEMVQASIPPATTHFNALLTSCVDQSLEEIAQQIFDLMPTYNCVPDVISWTILLSCHRRNLPRCLVIVEAMKAAGAQPVPYTFQELLEAHVLAKDGPGARALLQDTSKFGTWQRGAKVRRLVQEAQQLP